MAQQPRSPVRRSLIGRIDLFARLAPSITMSPAQVRSRQIHRRDASGELRVYDTHLGGDIPPGPGPKDRWAIEFRRAGLPEDADHPVIYTTSQKHAYGIVRALAEKEPDEWGLLGPAKTSRRGKSRPACLTDKPAAPISTGTDGQPNGDVVTRPAAGSRTPSASLSARLREDFDEEKISGYIRDLCEASNKVFTKDGKLIATEPDWRTRASGATILLAYRDGKPIQTKEEIKRREVSEDDVMRRLLEKPGYRRAIRGYIDQIERQKAAGAAEAKARVIDAQEET